MLQQMDTSVWLCDEEFFEEITEHSPNFVTKMIIRWLGSQLRNHKENIKKEYLQKYVNFISHQLLSMTEDSAKEDYLIQAFEAIQFVTGKNLLCKWFENDAEVSKITKNFQIWKAEWYSSDSEIDHDNHQSKHRQEKLKEIYNIISLYVF